MIENKRDRATNGCSLQFPAELAYIQIRSQKGTLNFPLEEFMCSTNLLPLSVRHAFVQRAS